MSKPIHIIYLSGFGSRYDHQRLRALSWWRFRNVTTELVPMRWESSEIFEQKLARIDKAVDRASGKRIVIIGESAGGSMAVHMYARRPGDLYKVMTLCGKNSHPETVGEHYYKRSPAFRTSMDQLNVSIKRLSKEQRQRFISIYPLYDSIVPVKETLLEGCRRVWLPAMGHSITIALSLTLFSGIMVSYARR